MNTPAAVREFLLWYRGDREDRPELDTPPSWLADRTPDPSQEFVDTILFEDYDLKGRLYDNPPQEEAEWVDPANSVDKIEQTWDDTVSDSGLEAFAWYMPFHYSTRRWGIYVSEEGLQLLAHLLYEWSRDLDAHSAGHAGWDPSVPDTTAVRGGGAIGDPAFEMLSDAFDLALEILLRHEWYHHQVELLAAYLEDAAGAMYYQEYYNQVYRSLFPSADCIEESAANAYVYRSRACARRAPSTDVFRALFYRTTRMQPDAYREYLRFHGAAYRRVGEHLAHQITTADPHIIADGSDSRYQVPLGAELPFGTAVRRPFDHVQVPIYIVKPQLYDLDTLARFKIVQLETDYETIETDTYQKAYDRADNDLKNRVDNTVRKLERNVNSPGFNWQHCASGYSYIRINDQYRMIVDRDDSEEAIELVDFGGHDLPAKYGCYT